MQEKIKYKCAQCNWSASIVAAWADLKPKRCGNKKCSLSKPSSYLKHADKLIVELPPSLKAEAKPDKKRKYSKKESKKEADDGEKTGVQAQKI